MLNLKLKSRKFYRAQDSRSAKGRSNLELYLAHPLRIFMARLAAIAAFAMLLVGCSSVETHRSAAPVSTIQQGRFQLVVRTGNFVMDKLLYEMAYQQFSDVLPLREKEPYTGVLEITFASSDQSWFVGTSSTAGGATVSGSGWYSKNGYLNANATVTAQSTTVSSGGAFTWQNSTMLAALKTSDGERLWSADYNYKGGWEMSGWVVNTPDEAARLVVKRLKERFKGDFGM
jgi:hypothetical protein